MDWKVGQAKQKLSQLIRKTKQGPQLIFNREDLVAAVVDDRTYREFDEWRKSKQIGTIGSAFAEFRKLCSAEKYSLKQPVRKNRNNSFVDTMNEVSM